MKKRIVRRASGDATVDWPSSIHPVLQNIYTSRGVRHAREIERSLQYLLPAADLKGMEAATGLLYQALREQQRIVVVGDFDADGATSSVLVVKALRRFGAREVSFLVPNRFKFGYGLTPEIVAVAAEREPDLIVTVDNGIASVDGVAAAKHRGIRVLVTDHHLPGTRLPEADAIVNPNQPGDDFPSKNLAGVGVIFYVMLALRSQLREAGWFESAGIEEPNMAHLLDLVALGSVADVVPLDYNNRILVDQGLRRIRAGQCSPGILALIEVGGRNYQRLTATDLGFVLGPRLNAAGRLEDMSIGINCLLSEDADEARRLARELDGLNRERREIEGQMQTQALAQLDQLKLDDDANLPLGLCLFDPDWHQGVIGILASRIKDRLHRPVIAFAQADDDSIKGSARSVEGVHIRDVLDAVASANPGLLTKFGGHAMAAGLTLERARLEDFQAAFDAEVRRHLRPEDLHGSVYSDGELRAEYIGLELAELLREAGPWGQGFPEPVFDGPFQVLNQRIVGEKHLKLVVRHAESRAPLDAIAFNFLKNGDEHDVVEGATVRLAYKVDVNEFRGQRNVQLIVEHLEPGG